MLYFILWHLIVLTFTLLCVLWKISFDMILWYAMHTVEMSIADLSLLKNLNFKIAHCINFKTVKHVLKMC